MFLNIILKESNRIESLVMDLLDLSHIEQQNEIETSYMNLSELAYNTIDNLQTQATNKNIEIKSEIEKDVIIEAHENKVAQVITNLFLTQLIILLKTVKLLFEFIEKVKS